MSFQIVILLSDTFNKTEIIHLSEISENKHISFKDAQSLDSAYMSK